MNETLVTVVGNLVDDPKLRITEQGVDLASFRLASTPHWRDREGRWTDGSTLFLGVTCWRQLAVNLGASGLRRGDALIVSGKLSTRSYEKDGQTRSVVELEAIAVGPDLNRGTVEFRKSSRPSDEVVLPDPVATEPAPGTLVGAGV
jgi:single-strand DNA-binding protein